MKKFEINRIESNYSVLVTLLSFRSPFEYLNDIEKELSKYILTGFVLLDEYAHNDDYNKRFITFTYKEGKITESSISFVDFQPDNVLINQSNIILAKNRDNLYELGIDLDLKINA